MLTVESEKIPIKLWTDTIEEEALIQAKNLANLPGAFHHIAVMPDVHVGFGMPIGGVLAMEGRIVPNAVGVDIGCGVRAMKTNLVKIKPDKLRAVLNQVQQDVPTGFYHHQKPQADKIFRQLPADPIIQEESESAKHQLGTLGGGNHFIDILKDKEGLIWIMIHSGSRNLGKKVADYYYRLAKDSIEAKQIQIPDRELSFLEFSSSQGQAYFKAMNFCLNFAKASRTLMIERVKDILAKYCRNFVVEEEIDSHHNYASPEKYFGKEVIVHRKGAIHAQGKIIVPGSMGTSSYICQGLENPESFASSAHGAGRTLGRRQARRQINAEQVKKEMRQKNIELFSASKADIPEESAAAYKDIDQVIKQQLDLAKPIIKLTPIGVLKG